MKGRVVFLSVLLAFAMVLVSCAKSTPPAPPPEPIPVYQSSPVVKASLIEIPASSDLNAVGIWQNIGPIINGEVACVRNLIRAEESGKTILYVGTGEPGRILKWSEATKSWSDIGYKIPKLMEEQGRGVNPFRWVGALAVDPTNPQTIYVGTGEPPRLAKTTDGGGNWTLIDYLSQIEAGEPRSLAISNENPKVVYFGTNDGLLKSVDGGENWELLDNGIATYGFIVWTVAIDPNDNSIVLAGGEDQSAILKAKAEGKDTSNWRVDYPHIPRLFYSGDGGKSWEELTSHSEQSHYLPGSDGNLVSIWIPLDIKFDPENSGIIYLGTEGFGLFYSEDRGKTWKSLGISGIITSIVINPINPQILYVDQFKGSKCTIFESRDKGQSWQKQNWQEIDKNLPPIGPGNLVISPDVTLFFGTFAYSTYPNKYRPAGVWRLKLK